MGVEIINHVLEKLSLGYCKTGFIAESTDEERMVAIVDNTSFCSIIQKIVRWFTDYAIKIQNKFKDLWSSWKEELLLLNGEAEAVGNGGNSCGFESFQTPVSRVHTKSTKTKSSHLHLNRPTGSTQKPRKNPRRGDPNKLPRFRGS